MCVMYLVIPYMAGVFLRLVYMLWAETTPKAHGLRRPWTGEEYLIEPLGWPAALAWWIVGRFR